MGKESQLKRRFMLAQPHDFGLVLTRRGQFAHQIIPAVGIQLRKRDICDSGMISSSPSPARISNT